MAKQRRPEGGKPDGEKPPLVGRNPLSKPAATPELLELAKATGQKIIHVSLVVRSTVENPVIDGQSFLALADFIPREGELIRTQNGKFCKVTKILYEIRPFALDGKAEAFGLFPTVFATLDEKDEV